LNQLHCEHHSWIVHAVFHVVSQMHVILLHQYKLIADEQVDGLNVVAIILTTLYQAPATTTLTTPSVIVGLQPR